MPTQEQNAHLGRSLATKQRQVKMLQEEVQAAGARTAQLQATAAQHQDRAVQVQSAQLAELSWREARIKHLEDQLEAQATLHHQTEQRLMHKCRLLQAWCFRTWWSLEEGSCPGILSEGALPPLSYEATASVKAPMPANWRSVLGFQGSLFHWLAAETIRLKSSKIQGHAYEVELPLPRKVRGRSASRRRHEH